jgi:hypothetical protein
MTPFYPAVQRYSFFREPDWRWRRALALAQSGRPATRQQDDDQTLRAARYLGAAERPQAARRERGLARSFGDLREALRLHEQGGPRALEAQARLLAGQPPDEVADRTALSGEAVRCYEALFFNVADRLHARDWVTLRVIRRRRSLDELRALADRLLLGFAYFGGVVVLEALLPFLADDLSWLWEHPDASTPQGRVAGSLRLIVRLELLPDDADTALTLARMHAGLIARDRQVSAALLGETAGLSGSPGAALDDLRRDTSVTGALSGLSATHNDAEEAARRTA